MRLLFAAAEVAPFAKVGGLADVAGGLPRQLAEFGHDVRVITPAHVRNTTGRQVATLTVPDHAGPATVNVVEAEGFGGTPAWLVDDPRYFGREQVYGYPDDRIRYDTFCRSVMALLAGGRWVPDILHVNDWHTASLTFGLRNLAWHDSRFQRTASVLTIHNLRYRGPDDLTDLLGPGIYYADEVTTVSPGYANEIRTPALGEGLDALLRFRGDRVTGIANGLDVDVFNPGTDTYLPEHFSATDRSGRGRNREALVTAAGLVDLDGPIGGIVSRLTEQKGIDIALPAIPALVAAGGRLVVLGSGDAVLERELTAATVAHPGRVAYVRGYDEAMARLIYGGADAFLMPSRFEPCGIGQLIAMRYGCIPIAHRTGGLGDTIRDSDGPDATGFLFGQLDPNALVGAWARMSAAFRDQVHWNSLVTAAMTRDASWAAPAHRYLEVYARALAAHGA